jgi:hypothetical protein
MANSTTPPGAKQDKDQQSANQNQPSSSSTKP